MPVAERRVPVPTAADLIRARAVVSAHLEPTPTVDTEAGHNAVLKLECLQPTGSFKVRGALAALAGLSEDARAAGVVTASAGNHALGVAFAATRLSVAATVVVPANASPAKVAALRGFPVRLVQHGAGYTEAERHALALTGQQDTNTAHRVTYLSAYNDPYVIAGHASIAAELRDQIGGPMTIVAPVGGGGLAAGLSLWASEHPDVHVVGVEAEASPAVSASIAAGRVIDVSVAATLADGLAGNLEPGSITPAIIAAHAHALVSVSEHEIRQAIRFLAERHGLLVEGAGAVAVAALLTNKTEPVGRPVALVTGRNIALPEVAEILGQQNA